MSTPEKYDAIVIGTGEAIASLKCRTEETFTLSATRRRNFHRMRTFTFIEN